MAAAFEVSAVKGEGFGGHLCLLDERDAWKRYLVFLGCLRGRVNEPRIGDCERMDFREDSESWKFRWIRVSHCYHWDSESDTSLCGRLRFDMVVRLKIIYKFSTVV